MASIGHMVERLQGAYNKGIRSQDSRLRSAHAYSILVSARLREVWKKREYERYRDFNEFIYQTLPCVEVIQAPQSECECQPNVFCTLWRTKHQIPETIGNETIRWVTDQSGLEYSMTTWPRYKQDRTLKYTGKFPRYFIRNEFVYFTQEPKGGIALINGLFRDPLEVELFPQKCIGDEEEETVPCKTYFEANFAIDGDLESLVIERALKELGVFIAQRPDQQMNLKDDDQQG